MIGSGSGQSGTSIAAAPAQVSRFGGLDPHPISWHAAALLAKGGGLVLLFVGTLVMVLFGSFPADCFTMTCSTSTSAGVQYGILLARLLWTIGGFGLAVGAGIQRQFVLHGPPPESTEAAAKFHADRRSEFWLLLAGIGILLLILLTQGTAVAPVL